VAWESHKEFAATLLQQWKGNEKSRTMEELQRKLTLLSGDLASWGKNSFGNVQAQIQQLQRELGTLRRDPNRMEPSPRENDVTTQLTTLLEQEEVMWRQRSRVQWLAAGDKNTQFFHLRASQRRRKNKVTELAKEDGSRVEGAEAGQYGDLVEKAVPRQYPP
jgi:hypothetical protein